jgi:hypothetical protein
MRNRLAMIGLAMAAAAVTACVDGSPNEITSMSSADVEASAAAKLKLDIADVLARAPGSRLISANEIEIGPGLTMKLGGYQVTATSSLTAYCAFTDMCVFNNANFNVGTFNGTQLNFWRCGDEWNLGLIPFPGGGSWSDKVSSIINNQTSNTWSYFYDYTGANNVWKRVVSVNADNHLANLALDTAEDGGGLNDRIDGVHVCGETPSPWQPNR